MTPIILGFLDGVYCHVRVIVKCLILYSTDSDFTVACLPFLVVTYYHYYYCYYSYCGPHTKMGSDLRLPSRRQDRDPRGRTCLQECSARIHDRRSGVVGSRVVSCPRFL